MKNKKNLIIVFGLLILVILSFLVWKTFFKNPVACTKEARLCPDGSTVVREGPSCEFAKCPPSEFGNDYIEQAIIDYLLTQNKFSWQTEEDSYRFCVIENLDPKKELFPLYVWALCEEFKMNDGNELEVLSGFSGPIKIDYPNVLSFYDVNRFSYEAPGEGSNYSKDIKEIFPNNVQKVISDFNVDSMIDKIDEIAFSEIIKDKPIRLDTLKNGSEISSPLIITGEAKGTWFFEGSAPVVLTDWDGLIIAEGYITAKEDWMTEDFVSFEGTIEFEVPEYGDRGSLILRKDNPSGLPEYDDYLEISIIFNK